METNTVSIGFSAGAERHIGQSRVSPFVGAAAGYRYSQNKTTTSDTSFSRENKQNRNIFSTTFSLGAEFWVTKNLSLAGRYDFRVSYESTKYTTTSTGLPTLKSSENGATLGVGTTSLILAVYF
jgi:opacity protein-like surface antigen